MIFGTTYDQRHKNYLAACEKYVKNRVKVFAWLPEQLQDGSYAWLRFIYLSAKVEEQWWNHKGYRFTYRQYYLDMGEKI